LNVIAASEHKTTNAWACRQHEDQQRRAHRGQHGHGRKKGQRSGGANDFEPPLVERAHIDAAQHEPRRHSDHAQTDGQLQQQDFFVAGRRGGHPATMQAPPPHRQHCARSLSGLG
jgi:hypothetical protein